MQIELGRNSTTPGSGPAMMDVEELLATRLLVQGNSGSGKSHLLRRILEQSAPYVQQVVIDPEGDFASLSEKFGHVVLDAERGLAELDTIARRVRQHRVSAVLNLESLDVEMQIRAAGTFLNALFDCEREFWFPMLVVVDEAQLFAPAVSGDVSEEARKLSLGAMTNLMCRGRKRGLAGIIATQRLAKLAKNVAAEASNFLMGRTFLDIDMVRAADLLGLERRQAETFRELARGHFVALGPALSRRPMPIAVGPVETQPRAGTPKLTPLPEQGSEETREMILAPVAVEPSRPMAERRTASPQPTTHEILEQLSRERPAAIAEEEAPGLPPEQRAEAHRAILSAMLDEADALFRSEAALYQDFQVRCRIARIGGGPLPLGEFRFRLNLARARHGRTIGDEAAFTAAAAIAAALPEEQQLVYLVLAAAAIGGLPCPSDLELAHRAGTHSAGRARSRLKHLEKSDHVVLRIDIRGNRAAALPDLGLETAIGDPRGASPFTPISAAAE